MPLLTRPDRRPTGAAAAASWLLARASTTQLALGRTGAGAVMLARPRVLPQLLGVDSATAARVGWSVQMLGAREVALGLGTLAALRSGDARAARTWVAAGVLCDAVDVLAVGVATARGRVRPAAGAATVAVALSAVGIGVREAREPALSSRHAVQVGPNGSR